MVRHHVQEDLDAFFMRLGHHLPVQFVRTVTRVDMVVIRTGVAVVRAPRGIVPEDRRTPEGGGAEVGDIIEMVDNSLDVTAMAAHRRIPTHLLRGQGRGIIGRVPIGKAVRDDQVNEVGRSETLPVGGTRLAGRNLIRIADHIVPLPEYQGIGTGLRFLRHLHIHEEVIGAVGRMDCLHFQSFSLNSDIIIADSLPVHEQLQVGLHPRPPGEGFHTGHLPGLQGQSQGNPGNKGQ